MVRNPDLGCALNCLLFFNQINRFIRLNRSQVNEFSAKMGWLNRFIHSNQRLFLIADSSKLESGVAFLLFHQLVARNNSR
jgi:hypothetical protein